jgi:RimJ/RimL family protein N-acetyltransferase
MTIETERLILRRWRTDDVESFAAMNADPRVMEFYPKKLNRAETEKMIDTIEERIERDGFGMWATELRQTGQLIGFIGLNVPSYPLPFSPCVEIGWRLAFDHWGQGYAQEGARAALKFGFDTAGLAEIVAFTAEINGRSRRVMERIGMTYDAAGDFDHPHVLNDDRLRRHVLYRRRRSP